MRVVLIGPPGSGKGTQGKLIHDRLGLPEIGTGDLLRAAISAGTPTGKMVQPILAAGKLVSDDLVNQLVKDVILGPPPLERFLMDGYPRTLAQAEWFDGFLHDQHLDLRCAILFSVSDEEVVRRLTKRDQGRADDQEDVIRKRLDVYHACTDHLVDYYRDGGRLAEISALDTVESIYQQVEAAIAG